MRADIFCRVIDNFGDIGVTWRLARQLQTEYGWAIRLWVDDLLSFQHLEPRVQCVDHQTVAGIEIVLWSDSSVHDPALVAIAMFSCDLPSSYIERMRARQTRWINLEYLSAEDWVQGCHGLPALRSDGLASHFYFPGFTERTGGLLREADLLARRDRWQADPAAQRTFLEHLGVSAEALAAWTGHGARPVDAKTNRQDVPARLISLFCYPDISIPALVETLSTETHQTVLLIPEGIGPTLVPGQYGNLFVERIPFLPQTEYDKVLWMADLNFVRGEDSIIRALWAGKPLVWQIYPQTEDTHLIKLNAWLSRSALPAHAQSLIQAWNQGSPQEESTPDRAVQPTDSRKMVQSTVKPPLPVNDAFASALRACLTPTNFQAWQEQAAGFCREQAMLPDLARTLNQFCLSQQNLQ